MIRRFDVASNLVRGGYSLLATIPTAAILTGVVPIPSGIRVLADYVTSAIALAFMLAFILLGDLIDRLSKTAVAVLIIVSVLGGAAAAAGYYNFTRHHVVALPNEPGVDLILPLNPSPELRKLMAPYGPDYTEALATSIQRERITELINEENSSTVIAMLSLLVIAQVLIISALVVGAWRLAHGEELPGA